MSWIMSPWNPYIEVLTPQSCRMWPHVKKETLKRWFDSNEARRVGPVLTRRGNLEAERHQKWMDKEDVVHIYNGMLFSHRKERIWVGSNEVGEPRTFFFSFIFISFRLITLQYCSGFRHTLTWISHGFTCVPHPDPPSHLPPLLYRVK